VLHASNSVAGSSTKEKKSDPTCPGHLTTQQVYELITAMIAYEDSARASGVDLASGRFKQLSQPEKRLFRAELISDYIRLAIRRLDPARTDFESALENFCKKICDTGVPSLELMGTFLAALDIVSQDARLNRLPEVRESMQNTILLALQRCLTVIRSCQKAEDAH
jgi:hypothetical protein